MEFTITCPIDGQIEVGLEDIDTVVLRDEERADITFVCPHCGTAITVGAIIPSFLVSAMRALAEDAGAQIGEYVVYAEPGDEVALELADDHVGRDEAYLEYFRRQLEHVVWVEDALAEIDAGAS